MNTKERIEELEEMRHEFILNESIFDDENPSWGEVADAESIAESKWDKTDEGKELKALLERESVNVCFRKFPEGDLIAFIDGYPCNTGMIMSYQHIGQHGEASLKLLDELKPVTADEYAGLLQELESIGYDVTVVDNVLEPDGDDYGYFDQKNFD